MSTTERRIVEFDHHAPDYRDTRYGLWAELRKCPVAFNPAYGGFWVVSGYDEVNAVSRDEETFTSVYVAEPADGIPYLGIMGVPRLDGVPSAGIAESLPEPHAELRRVINPFLLPPAVERLEPFMQQSATWFLDQKIESGAMEMVDDFTNPVPAVLTLRMLGLPEETWPYYAEVFHAMIAFPPDSPEAVHALALIPDMMGHLIEIAAERRKDPGEDMFSALVKMEVDGRCLTDEELIGVLWNLIGGGLDTTTSLTSLSLHWLEAHPDARQRLIDDPSLLGPACEEFLRFFSVNETLTRTVTRDVELGGQQLHRGDHLMLSWLSANRDEQKFDRAHEVVIDRAPNPHLAFGVGPRRCIGLHLARALFRVMVTEVLGRIPDYTVDQAGTTFYQGNPELFGVVHMPVTFTPGPVVGVDRPF